MKLGDNSGKIKKGLDRDLSIKISPLFNLLMAIYRMVSPSLKGLKPPLIQVHLVQTAI